MTADQIRSVFSTLLVVRSLILWQPAITLWFRLNGARDTTKAILQSSLPTVSSRKRAWTLHAWTKKGSTCLLVCQPAIVHRRVSGISVPERASPVWRRQHETSTTRPRKTAPDWNSSSMHTESFHVSESQPPKLATDCRFQEICARSNLVIILTIEPRFPSYSAGLAS